MRLSPHFLQTLSRWLPWLGGYRRDCLAGDLSAGLIVAVMLIPQSLAYAMLAGLPPQVGLYASIAPVLAYALLGSSMTMAVGPVAVASLMTASALAPLAVPGSPQYVVLAVALAALSGLMLLAFGALRLGVMAHFLSHPVISGFISGSAILIILGQLKPLLGLTFSGQGALEIALGLLGHGRNLNGVATALGLGAVLLLWLARAYLARALQACGLRAQLADVLSKFAPIVVVVGSTALVSAGDWHGRYGVAVVGQVPAGLPTVQWPVLSLSQWAHLWLPALLIGLVGFVESVSVAQSLALKRKEKIDPNRELLGIGAANCASALCGGYAVSGSFSRSSISFAAGANTPLAGVVSAVLMLLVLWGLTGWFAQLPQTVLAATIIVAVGGLVDWQTLKKTWGYDRADALCLISTFAGVLVLGVEEGVVLGLVVSLAALVWRSSQPHMAVVGRVPGTEHFRNVQRHAVETLPHVLAMRVDENLFFANAAAVEQQLEQKLHEQTLAHGRIPAHVVFICSAVNHVDSSALEMLTELQNSLQQRGVELHLSEVKGPVMDRLRTTELGQALEGRIWLSTHAVMTALAAK